MLALWNNMLQCGFHGESAGRGSVRFHGADACVCVSDSSAGDDVVGRHHSLYGGARQKSAAEKSADASLHSCLHDRTVPYVHRITASGLCQ